MHKGILSLASLLIFPTGFVYHRRSNEMTVPKNPITAKPMITNPIGTLPAPRGVASTTNVGITRGGGEVKVGNRVGGTSTINCAARVGSIVAVVRGVGVGGGSTIGIFPSTDTRGEYTQPMLPGTPG